MPPDAELTPRNEAFPAWADVPDKLKAFYARQMEVFAGYSENADHNVGRVIDAIDELGELDNTLIVWIWGDNGASMEGTLTGSFNELTMQNGIPLTDEMQLQLAERYGGMDAWGTEIVAPHYGAAWAWAGNTPFQWGKQVASHLGGNRDPLVVHWPARLTDTGGCARSGRTSSTSHRRSSRSPASQPRVRRRHRPRAAARVRVQRLVHRCERARAAHPAVLRGGRQPSHVQGRLVARHEDGADPVGPHAGGDQAVSPGIWNPDDDPTELYYLPNDFSQAHDLAAERPDKVAELRELFWQEAERYDVLPLLAAPIRLLRPARRRCPRSRSSSSRAMSEPASGHDPARSTTTPTRSAADLIVPPEGADGVIVAKADHLGGFSLWVDQGKLTHTYSMMGVFIYRQQATDSIADRRGQRPHGVRGRRRPSLPPAVRSRSLSTTSRWVADAWTTPCPFASRAMPAMDIGRDNGGVVDRRTSRESHFPSTGPSARSSSTSSRTSSPRRPSCMQWPRGPRPATR